MLRKVSARVRYARLDAINNTWLTAQRRGHVDAKLQEMEKASEEASEKAMKLSSEYCVDYNPAAVVHR